MVLDGNMGLVWDGLWLGLPQFAWMAGIFIAFSSFYPWKSSWCMGDLPKKTMILQTDCARHQLNQ